MKATQLTRLHFHNGAKFAFHKKHGWMRYLNSELGAACSGWLPINKPAHVA